MDLLHWSSLQEKSKIIGVDEAGRGCLCGPVYASAVVFNSSSDPSSTKILYKDSKLLTSKMRDKLYDDIMENHWVGIGFATSFEVDQINILQATFLAMRRALLHLKSITESSFSSDFNLQKEGHIIVDGNQRIPGLEDYNQTTLIKGDQLVPEISAASIVAKVSRDRYLDQLDAQFPEYEFRKHKGYGTLLHKQKIKELGPCPEHRITFSGVREYVSTEQKQSYQGTVV